MADADNVILGAATVSVDATDIGFTSGDVSWRYEPSFTDVKADQAKGTIKKFKNDEMMFITIPMLEITLDRIQEATGQPDDNASTNQLYIGYGSQCNSIEHEIILTGFAPACGTRVITAYKCVSIGSPSYAMSRENVTILEAEYECLKNADGYMAAINDTPAA